jgi:low affinity Fe/Cu permease
VEDVGGLAKRKQNSNPQSLYRFIISIVILAGGGMLLFYDKASEIAIAAITAVITFWCTR